MQRHGTLAYIENIITGNLDKQQQAKLQYFGTKAAKQAPVLGHKSGKASTSTLPQKRQSKHQYCQNIGATG
jgi:hypothetical protein